MPKLGFSDGLALAGIALTLLLVVLDKADKLKGPLLLVLLAAAAALIVPLALGNSWISDAPSGMLKFSRGLLLVLLIGVGYSLLAIWISTGEAPTITTNHSILPPPPSDRKSEPPPMTALSNIPSKSATLKSAVTEKPPTLSDLFKTDFPNVSKATDEAVLNSATDNSVLRIKRQVYMDFEAKAQFVGFYLPFLTSNQTFDVSIALIDAVQPALDKLDEHVPVGGDAGGIISAKDLIFSGRVYLYHEEPLTNVQKAGIVQAYSARHYDVSFRGLDYAGTQASAWYQERDAKKSH